MRLEASVRKNDNVVVISGRDKGKRGRVLRVIPEKTRVIVEGVNFIKRHTRPNPQKNVKGGIVEREAPVHASNVQIVCPECGKATRTGHRKLDDGTRVRVCRKCEGVIDK
jgi:large subunit ribosomal protein L24